MVVDRDNGIEVPEILVILKELVLVNQGEQVEGLFRRAGSEIEMKKLKKAIEEGPWSELKSKDVHSVATLIKRWFKELPKRILDFTGTPNPIPLQQLAQDQSLKLNLQQFLSPVYARLLNWLFHLCLKVIHNYPTTKMDPKNLGAYIFLLFAHNCILIRLIFLMIDSNRLGTRDCPRKLWWDNSRLCCYWTWD